MDNKTVLKTLGVKILKNLPISRDVKIIGTINGFFIYPYSYYWIVKGKMPLKYADELYKSRALEIRVAGGHRDNKPIEHCTSDKLEEYIEEQIELIDLIGFDAYLNNIRVKEQELMKDKLDSFYVETYHIDKLEGLKKVVDIIKEYDIQTEW